MNKVILMGRLTKNPDVRYASNNSNLAVAKYILAVRKKSKQNSEADADFIPCVCFGKTAEFAEKYLKKGLLISIVGSLSVQNYTDKEGEKRYKTEVIVNEHYFTVNENKAERKESYPPGMIPENPGEDDDFPF